MDQPGGAHAVLDVLIPFVAQDPFPQDRRLPCLLGGDAGVAPETPIRVVGRYQQGIVAEATNGVERSYNGILRLRADGIERPRITPGTRPVVLDGIQLAVRMSLFVGHEGAVRRLRAIVARLPPRSPHSRAPAQECQVDARVPRGLDVPALPGRPVRVVPDRHEHAMVPELRAAPIGIHASKVADIVAVALEPTHQRIF